VASISVHNEAGEPVILEGQKKPLVASYNMAIKDSDDWTVTFTKAGLPRITLSSFGEAKVRADLEKAYPTSKFKFYT
jgi:hypothetical protein